MNSHLPRLVLVLFLAACSVPSEPRIEVPQDTVLIDEPLAIRVTGLTPGQEIALRLNLHGRHGNWSSHGSFVADDRGRVDLERAAPASGSYSGVDPMGLIWSARPDSAEAVEGDRTEAGFERLEVTVSSGGQELAAATFWRRWVRAGVEAREVRENGLVAAFYEPRGAGPHPGLLVLGGSECGLPDRTAEAFASHGYAALALAYCAWPDRDGNPRPGMENLPSALELVPLEYVGKALDWLARAPSVDRARIGVWGGSKGGELALLIASSNPIVRAVVAKVPSHVAWQGINFSGGARSSSWSHGGEPVPYVPYTGDTARINRYAGDREPTLTHLYRASLDDTAAVRRAAIPVERVNAAVLVISGRDDLLWPSAFMAEHVVERLREYDHPYPYEHLSYEGAGHAIGRPYSPTTTRGQGSFPLGGTPEGYARAMADSWPRVLRFLEENLRNLLRS